MHGVQGAVGSNPTTPTIRIWFTRMLRSLIDCSVLPFGSDRIYFPNGVGHRWQAAWCLGATSIRGGSMTSQVPEMA